MRSSLAILLVPPLLAGCGGSAPATKGTAPAKAEPVAHESELLKLTLTPDAQRRLAIATVRVGEGDARSMRETSGEVVVPSVGAGVPTSSLSNIAQIGSQQAAADGEVARTAAQVRLARIALNRAAGLVREEAGSIRARDEAAAALATAEAAARAAVAQRRLLGPPVAAMSSQSALWVRVPVFGTDVAALARGQAAEVRPLGSNGQTRAARPVQAPPSADAAVGTVDLYYALDNRDRAYRVGQRVAVSLPLAGGARQGLSVPASAVLRDVYGGEWVYQRTAPASYVRRRIEIASSVAGRVIVSRGLSRGDEIVIAGAMELFGTEFGVAH
ncbi:efflux RND transporter periplasmic adaptor subunit [Sphingomonas sp. DT-204]|uniref:efflux RND transporter periplasmic adaptor subunit n=1 Tax=Sphingomonas sp. DT-204 TaxID=3396166 RepID=UPI003F1CBB69